MFGNSENITIPNCPICGGSHTYSLKVERSLIMKFRISKDMHEKSRAVRKTRLFTCPIKHKDFQGIFVLHDTSSSRIKSIEVIGLAEESSDE